MSVTRRCASRMREEEITAASVEVNGEVLGRGADSDAAVPHVVALIDERVGRHAIPFCKVTTRKRVSLAGVVLVCCEATLVFTSQKS